MTDKYKIYYQSNSEPVKVIKNGSRPGVILRQASSVIFVDLEIADRIIDAMADLVDSIEAEVTR